MIRSTLLQSWFSPDEGHVVHDLVWQLEEHLFGKERWVMAELVVWHKLDEISLSGFSGFVSQ
jgi:hypothetical protein